MTGPQEIWLLETTWVDRKAVVHLWHSTDAGQNWQEALPGRLAGGTCLYCRGNERWVFSGRADNMNFASSDGGKSWRRIDFQGLLVGGAPWPSRPTPRPMPPRSPMKVSSPMCSGTVRGQPLAPGEKHRRWPHLEAGALPADLPAGGGPNAMYFATSWKGWLGFAAAESCSPPMAAAPGSGVICPRTRP